jgi:hypothetical protein
MPASAHRGKIITAVIIGLFVLLALAVVWIRSVRKPQPSLTIPANTPTNEDVAVTPPQPPPSPPRGRRALFSTIPVLSFDEKQGARENVDHLGYWDRTTWVRYNAVDLGAGVSTVAAVLSCGRQFKSCIIYFHLDSHDGPVFAELPVPATQGFEPVYAPADGATGVHDVFITCNEGGFNLQSIKFIGPQAATNLIPAASYSGFSGIKESRPGIVGHTDGGDWIRYEQINFGQGVSSVAVDLAMGPRDAKIEFHLAAIDGPLIATLTPASTGDWMTFQVQETRVQGANGIHNLFLTFHGERGLPDIRSIQFKPE